jgi:two-component system phosphate regulon sensor histidine kinase PhoR
MQKDFINNMTHEFKTPISTIRISAEFFLNHPTIKKDPKLIKYAQIINAQSARLNEQVERVLQVSKLEKNIVDLTTNKINLHNIILSVAESFELRVTELGGIIDLKLLSNNPYIFADSLHLTNVLNSLVDNAIKYSKNAPHIILKTTDSNDTLELQIEDQGIGISKENQKKIFDKFYRVPTGNVHNVKGFGLGLFYVYTICQAHGWLLKVFSDPEKGTIFTISFKKQKI